jgi:penicillin-binding protein 2
MKSIRLINLLLVAVFLASCGGRGEASKTDEPGLPTPQLHTTETPDVTAILTKYLEAMKAEDYITMYRTLSAGSQAAISEEDFKQRHIQTFDEMGLQEATYQIGSTLTNPEDAEAAYSLTYDTACVGEITRDLTAHFALENGQWKLRWDEGLILPELNGGNRLAMDYKTPARGDIYDRSGHAIATQPKVYALGLQPGLILPDQEPSLLAELSRITGRTTQEIADSYAFADPSWYIPVGEVSEDELKGRYDYLASFSGLYMQEYDSRYYSLSGVAPHATGYVHSVPAEELSAYKRKCFSGAEQIGSLGIEENEDQLLTGTHGGTLYLIDSEGNIGQPIAQGESQAADTVYMTIDKDLQQQVQQALTGFVGAAVVLERDTGRVLAIASSPDFDPNLFAPNNPNNVMLSDILADPNQPLYNRATQGQYPLGSVFKIMTMAAGLESDVFNKDSQYLCEYDFTELSDRVLHDWTWDHCQNELQTEGECTTRPSGMLTLPEGLMRSCNPWFWHIGLTLFNEGKKTDVADMARAFGLGAPTGIEIAESPGVILDPGDGVAATNQAIGQGDVQVTPLQVARLVAAVGNGGTLYRPQLIEKVETVNGDIVSQFEPDAQSTLPLSEEDLKTIQDAMHEVIVNPRGTAHYRLGTVRFPIWGKTGTAESGIPGYPHAWFAGYSNAQIEGKPDLAIAVILENEGEGSQFAAPVFKRIIESYFYGKPQSLYPWESSFGVWRTATPPVTPTPEGGDGG